MYKHPDSKQTILAENLFVAHALTTRLGGRQIGQIIINLFSQMQKSLAVR